jgi:hypothetical protein
MPLLEAPSVSPTMLTNHGDEVILQRNFWTRTANTYLAAGIPDVDYFQVLLERASHWQQEYDRYVAHLKVTNTSFHLAS